MDPAGHILVAEDDTTDAFFLQRAFNRAGVTVNLHFVRDGQEVVDYLDGKGAFADRGAHPLPEVLLLDLKMPRLDGFDVLAWIRKQPALSRLEVVIFTSSGERKDVSRAYGLGAHAYVVKPHSVEELNALVGQLKKQWAKRRPAA